MPLNPKILKILACPKCKTEVKLTPDEKSLKCINCNRIYPIREDIPIMLISEASMESNGKMKD